MNKLWALGMLLMVLCITDAFLTAKALSLGATELNLALNFADYSTVMWVKIAVSVAGSISLVKLKAYKVLVLATIIMEIVCAWNLFILVIAIRYSS